MMTDYQKEVCEKISSNAIVEILLDNKNTRNKLSFYEKKIARKYLNARGNISEDDVEVLAKIIRELCGMDRAHMEKKTNTLTGEETMKLIPIKDIRKELGISQKEIGRLFNVSPATVSRWEAGKIQAGYAEAIMALLGIIKGKQFYKTTVMRLRWVNHKTLEDAAEKLHITAKELWEIEIKNRCPLNLLNDMSKLYHCREKDIPIRKNEKKETYIKSLKTIRDVYGYTGKEAAEKYGISSVRYKTIEQGRESYPTYEEAIAIAACYETTPEELLLMHFIERRKPRQYDIERLEYYRKVKGIKQEDFLKMIGIGYKAYRKAVFSTERVNQICRLLDITTEKIKQCNNKFPDRKISAKKIKKTREQNGVSMASVSKELGIKKSWLKAVENGRGRPSLTLLSKIAELYGKSVTYFFEDGRSTMSE